MEEAMFLYLMFGLIILGVFTFLFLLLIFGDYVKCKRCGKWHDYYDFCFLRKVHSGEQR